MALIGACGDDAQTPVDARPIDSRMVDSPAPDAPGGVNFFSDEGGEVRFEYVRFADGTADTRVLAYFEANDDVDNHAYPTIPGCTLVTDDTKWPTSQPMNRDYVDVGQLTLTNGTKLLNLSKSSLPGDELQRAHGAGNWYHHWPYFEGGGIVNDGATFISEKSSYDVIFSGSAEWPATLYEDAIYFPADFAYTSPGPTVANVSLVADTDLTFTWDVVPSQQPAGVPEPWSVVGFLQVPGAGAVVLCVEPTNDGSITVPAAYVNMIRTAAPNGLVIRQTFHHQVRELTNGTTVKNRRIDMIGVWCYQTGYTSA